MQPDSVRGAVQHPPDCVPTRVAALPGPMHAGGEAMPCADFAPVLRPGFSTDSSPDSAAAVRFRPGRFYGGLGAALVADVGVMVGLSRLWYEGERVPFHWVSDSREGGPPRPDIAWLDDWYTDAQMDKGGHVFITWQLTRLASAYARWSGLSNRSSALTGALVATVFQSQVEIFDGFDPIYGASRTDLLANLVGAAIGYAQVAHPAKTDWFSAKASYHPTRFYDPDLSSIPPLRYVGNAIKDYEGLTYWVVVKPAHLGLRRWPRWLGVSLGYGADGLTGYAPNCCLHPPDIRREFYLSLDLDVLETERHRLPRVLRPLVSVLSVVRLPLPAYEIGGRGRRWHWLYY